MKDSDSAVVNGKQTPKQARELRQSLDTSQRELVETTVADLLDLLGRRHTMAILSEFAFAGEPLRFSHLETSLEVPPNTLSTRLQELTEVSLLHRRRYDEVPPRVEYEPTEKLRALFPMFGHLHCWAVEHELDTPISPK